MGFDNLNSWLCYWRKSLFSKQKVKDTQRGIWDRKILFQVDGVRIIAPYPSHQSMQTLVKPHHLVATHREISSFLHPISLYKPTFLASNLAFDKQTWASENIFKPPSILMNFPCYFRATFKNPHLHSLRLTNRARCVNGIRAGISAGR